MDHNPSFNPMEVEFLPTPTGNMTMYVPCTCGRKNCTFNFFMERRDWQHNPAPVPQPTYILGSKIAAIKELRTIQGSSLVNAKAYVDKVQEDGGTHNFWGSKDGYSTRLALTYISGNDHNHAFAITTHYFN